MSSISRSLTILGLVLGGVVFLSCSTTKETAPGDDTARPSARELPPVPPPVGRLDDSAYAAAMMVKLPETEPEEMPGLHNVYHLSDNIVSGAEPEGEVAFQNLRKMGIKTVLSVDGKVPDVETAEKYGIRYVHVPIQYRGITNEEVTQIAKTFREQEGPFYVHCFHGKHRGPAAAAIGRVVLDGAPREQAIAEMRQWCGTSKSYEGLYRTIAVGTIPEHEQTASYAWSFPSKHAFAGIRQGMIEASRSFDALKYLSSRNWQPDSEHPDANALNESRKLATYVAELAALEDVKMEPEDFRTWMHDTVGQADDLRDAIEAWDAGTGSIGLVDETFKKLSDTCDACHKVYRN